MKRPMFTSVLVRVIMISMLCLPFNWVAIYAAVATPALPASVVTVNNNFSMSDTVYIASGVAAGDVVKVYNASKLGIVLGQGTVASGGTSITVTLTTALNTGVGTVYVTVKKPGTNYLESLRTAKAYTSETSTTPTLAQVSAINYKFGINDSMTVSGLLAGDVVRVYANSTATTALVTSNAVASGATSISISSLNMFSVSTGGTVHITVKGNNKRESNHLTVTYKTDVSTSPLVSNVSTFNAKNTANDSITVNGLTTGDVVKVYSDSKSTLALGTSSAVTSPNTSIVLTGSALLNNSAGGTVHVSITSTDKNESVRTVVSYGSDVTVIPGGIVFTPVNNRDSIADTLAVTGLSVNDVVNVYQTLTSNVSLGTATVSSGTSVTVSAVNMFNTSAAGVAFVTITSQNKNESLVRSAVNYQADVSLAPKTMTVVQNPTGNSDTVTVTGLAVGDVVNVYDVSSGGTASTATVTSGNTVATVSLTLAPKGGTAFISLTRNNKSESIRVAKTYPSEPVSSPTLINRISGTNQKVAVADTLSVTTLVVGDTVLVYDELLDGNLLGQGTVASGTVANLNIADLLPNTEGGKVYVAIKNTGKLESSRVAFGYGSDKSSVPTVSDFEIFNARSTISDTIDVSNLNVGDTIRIYSDEVDGTMLAEETVASGSSSLSIAAVDLLPTSIAGQVYATLETVSKSESDRVALFYLSDQSVILDANDVTIEQNKKGVADAVTIENLSEGAVINLYDSIADDAAPIANSAPVGSGLTQASISVVDLLDAAGGDLYLTVTNDDMEESDKLSVTYDPEVIANALDPTQITIVNNKSGQTDSITVAGMQSGDTIYVYTTDTATTPAHTQNWSTGSTIVISGTDLLTATSDRGTIYLSVTNENKSESATISYDYLSDRTPVLFTSQIVITQNPTGSSDTVVVSGLKVNDVVKWYDDNLAFIRSVTVSSGTTASFTGIDLLTDVGGDIYLTITSDLKTESGMVTKSYVSEPRTTLTIGGLSKSSVNNRTGVADTFTVNGLASGDTILAYDALTAGNLLAQASVATGKTFATISLVDLFGQTTGTVYVSIKQANKLEALTRVAYTYSTVAQTAPIVASNVQVINLTGTSNDKVVVLGLTENDEVNVYSDANTSLQLCESTTSTNCTWTVASGGNSVEITDLAGLSDNDGGVIYLTVQNTKLDVSNPVAVHFKSARTLQPLVSQVTVNNENIGTDDSVVVAGLATGDVVNIYDVATGGTAIANSPQTESSGSVTFNGSEFLVNAGGAIYVTITSANKAESARTKVSYSAINKTQTPTAITIVNNPTGVADSITITSGYSDVALDYFIKVYDAATETLLTNGASGALLLASGEIEFSLADIITASSSGTVKVTIQQENLLESDMSASITFDNDYTAPVPNVSNVQILNDDSGSDVVRIKWSNLQVGDVVYIYDAGTTTLLNTGGDTVTTANLLRVSMASSTLNVNGGSVDITVKRADLAESAPLTVAYKAE